MPEERKKNDSAVKQEKPDVMKSVATAIVNARFLIIALFIVAAIYCAASLDKVKTDPDLASFLPKETETRRGLSIMEDEFITYGTANVMISNVSWDIAKELADEIAEFDHVTGVDFDDSPTHFKDSAALLTISFDGVDQDEDTKAELEHVKEFLSGYDIYVSTTVGYDFSAELASQMGGVLGLALIVIVLVLLYTSRSYFEVVIYMIVFAFAALLNMGTNYLLGTISSITNSIAIILQLALAIDYAIIFSHRYQDEVEKNPNVKEALIDALSKAIVEISASSLTTVSGLIALTMMQFRLGYDMGVVLSKGILCSLITVFLLMPALIMLFPKQLKKTQHKNLVPNVRGWGVFLTKTKVLFVIPFIAIIPFAIKYSGLTEYAFSDATITEITQSPSREAMHKIIDTFDDTNVIALVIPSGEYESEKRILSEISKLDKIRSATGLANTKIDDEHVLTDAYTPRMFAELLDLDIEQATLLFQAYGLKHEEYQVIFGNVQDYSVILLDMFEYLFEKIDQGVISLSPDQTETLEDMREELKRGTDQLRGTDHDRIVISAAVPDEGEESLALIEKIRDITEEYYDPEDVLLVGNITNARDQEESYSGDSMKINILTISFIFIILLFTFKSWAAAVLLVFVIQGSIWINFAIPYYQGLIASFVTNMIVSAIQMGATIDYAIVILNHYLTNKKTESKKDAMADAVNEGFATVITSGSIMTLAGFLIGFRVTDVYVSHIGLAVGRGAFISIILVMTVLPQLILLFDKLIEKTSFKIHLDLNLEDEEGSEQIQAEEGVKADEA